MACKTTHSIEKDHKAGEERKGGRPATQHDLDLHNKTREIDLEKQGLGIDFFSSEEASEILYLLQDRKEQ
ncbi:MAG: hypothetical protein Q8P99_01845 [bacterium]|nr:hypothetical protein [bacterium]MDZ4231604.1 hypothetical protein [Patescibacteria group bacterium]